MPLAAMVARAEPPMAAAFDLQRADLGADGPTEADVARPGPSSDPPRECGGCARKPGANVAATGEMRKVSNLILNIDVHVKAPKAGTPEGPTASTSAAATTPRSITE